jgi:6-phosphogluconolactonase
MPLLRKCDDPAAAAAAAAEWLAVRIAEDVGRRGRCVVALAGGKTPELLDAALVALHARTPLPLASVRWTFSDERAVPPDDPRSNYGLARRALFVPLGVADDAVLRLRGEAADVDAECRRAEAALRDATPDGACDVVLLGMGKDGHVASLFPASPALDVADRLIVPAEPGLDPRVGRLTFTLEALSRAREVLFLATGAEKADVLRRVLVDKDAALPATRVAPRSRRVAWFVDRAAAARV